MAIVEFGEFKGNKMIILKRTPDDQYPFQFGVSKAKLVVEHIEDIRKFVEENQKP
ncbi:MAG: hypothetical protein HY748_00025 [Elusimicrobia bacterium]|nr:hypothetical protein [Elusimicrobiota bacterium]